MIAWSRLPARQGRAVSTMTQDVRIPIALWICAAVVVHAMATGGIFGVTVAEEKLAAERKDIREMVTGVRDHFDVTEVDFGDGEREEEPKLEDEPKPTDVLSASLAALTEAFVEPLGIEALPEPPKEEAKKEEPEPEPPKEEEKKEEEKTPEEKKAPELVIIKDNRIAIRQANDKDQPDNPNAPRLADKANHVEEETQSRIRSTDQVSAEPSPGSNQAGPTNEIGNSDKQRIAQGEEADGDPERAPGENADKSPHNTHQSPVAPSPATADNRTGGNPGAGAANPSPPSPTQPRPAVPGSEGAPGAAAPSVVSADEGYSEEIPEASAGGSGVGAIPGAARPAVPGNVAIVVPKAPGLGQQGGPNGKISLNWNGFVQAVGEEELEKQRAAAGKKVRSEHRGRYDTNKFERWLPDIENYDPSVKVGNQTALNAAQSAFATYLSTIHNAIHPIFAEEFLGLLNGLPRGHELNEHLVAHVEIILSRDEGKILKMGITKRSGSTVFDAAALEAINRAGPFGAAPETIVSADGNVYLHWEFHRDPVDACSTRNAKPFIVKDPKPIKPSTPVRKGPTRKQPKKEGEKATEKPGQQPPKKAPAK